MIAQGNNIARLDIINQPSAAAEIARPNGPISPLRPITNAVDRIFTSDQEQTRTQKARNVMGGLVAELADEELEVYITEFQSLIDDWLDEFERQTFDDQTLKEVLGQG